MKPLPKKAPWFDFDDQYDKYLGLKRDLYLDDKRRNAVFSSSGEHKEFWKDVLAALKNRYHTFLSLNFKNEFKNDINGEVWDLGKCDPFLAAALSFQEDFVLLELNDGSPKIKDASVAFPSRWNPVHASGQTIEDTHKPGVRFTRLIHPFPFLHLATDLPIATLPSNVTYTSDNVRNNLFLRLEKQRFFPGNIITGNNNHKNLVLMTIKTYVLPLYAVEANTRFAQSLLNLYQGFRDEPVEGGQFIEYRGGTSAFIDPVIEYLTQVVSANSLQTQNFALPKSMYDMPTLVS